MLVRSASNVAGRSWVRSSSLQSTSVASKVCSASAAVLTAAGAWFVVFIRFKFKLQSLTVQETAYRFHVSQHGASGTPEGTPAPDSCNSVSAAAVGATAGTCVWD